MNIFDIEAAYIARLQAAPGMPAGQVVAGTLSDIDWTSSEAPVLGMQVTFDGFEPLDATGFDTTLGARYDVSLHLDFGRATPAQIASAAAAFNVAIAATSGWQYRPGREARLVPGERTGREASLLRLSFAFTTPVFFTGQP